MFSGLWGRVLEAGRQSQGVRVGGNLGYVELESELEAQKNLRSWSWGIYLLIPQPCYLPTPHPCLEAQLTGRNQGG